MNYLIAFIYRELCYSDALHQFAVKKINVELEEVKDSSKKVLQKLALKDYEFGSVIPIFSSQGSNKRNLKFVLAFH